MTELRLLMSTYLIDWEQRLAEQQHWSPSVPEPFEVTSAQLTGWDSGGAIV